jgi:SAM-dependent methyltransferase
MQSEQFYLNFEVEQKHWWFLARRHILGQLIAQVLPPSKDTLLIDVGCGTGGNLGFLSEHYDCVGIDPCKEAIELAGKRFPNVHFIHGEAPKALGNLLDRAKLFLLSDVLEHVGDDFLLFSELLAAARPGTYFLLTVPADLSLWSPHDISHGHYRRYDRSRLQEVSRLYPIIKAVRMLSHRRGRASGEADTDLKMPFCLVNWLLERIFRGESDALMKLLADKHLPGYHRGVSLITLLRRETARVVPRTKPSDVAPDHYDPSLHCASPH